MEEEKKTKVEEEVKTEEKQTNPAEKKYEIYEVLAAAAMWADDPTNEEKIEALEEIKRGMIIRGYMPLAQKELCLRKALIDMRSEEDGPYSWSVLYEIALLFDGLLAYVVNLNPEMDNLYKDRDFYDLLWVSGIVEYILQFCKEDYDKFVRMADRMISFDNIKELVKNIELTSPEQVERLTKEFERFITESSTEKLAHLGKIAAANDPLLMQVKQNIEGAAYAEIMKKEKEAEQENKG